MLIVCCIIFSMKLLRGYQDVMMCIIINCCRLTLIIFHIRKYTNDYHDVQVYTYKRRQTSMLGTKICKFMDKLFN